MSFVSTILDSTADLESPQPYFYWSALTTIAAVLGKRVYLDRQKKYRLYPNVYTFILSKQSGLRKSIPINLAKKLAFLCGNVRIIDGQNSIQGILKELSQVKTLPNNEVLAEAQGLLISGEFANFLLQDRDAAPLTVLTDMYDTHNYEEGFNKRLSSQDIMELKGLCLTGLFGSNEVHFRDVVPDNAIRGGFLARCFCIYADKRQTINSLMNLTEEEDIDSVELPYKDLTTYLKILSLLKGEFRVSNPARKCYNEWYHEFTRREIDDETGTLERIGDTILKAAMLISLSRDPEMLISIMDMEEAIEKTTTCFTHVRKLVLGSKAPLNTRNDTFRIVMAQLISAPDYTRTRQYLLIKGGGIFDVYDFDAVIEHMIQAGAVVAETLGLTIIYKLKEHVLAKYNKLEGE